MNEEEIQRLIDRCDKCDLTECINCEISWTEIQALKGLLDLYNRKKEYIKENEIYRKNLFEAHEKLVDLYNNLKEIEEEHRKENGLLRVELEKNEEKTELTMKLINANCIHKDKIKTILGVDTDSEEALLSLLETIVDENNRLEDIEDRKVQIEYNNVFNKGVESVKNKIKEKIEELNKKEQKELKGTKGQDRYFIKQLYQAQITTLQELLED